MVKDECFAALIFYYTQPGTAPVIELIKTVYIKVFKFTFAF